MGITIHYNGKIERARLAEMLDAARLYCAEQRWAALEIEERIIGHVERITEPREEPVEGVDGESTTRLFPIDDTLRGLLITIHPKADPVWLTCDNAGELVYYRALNDAGEYWEYKTLFTTTQFAGVNTHIALCEFLHWLNDTYMPGLRVYDEGGYYESGDAQQLARAFANLNMYTGGLQATPENETGDDSAASAIENDIDAETPEPKRKKLNVQRGISVNRT